MSLDTGRCRQKPASNMLIKDKVQCLQYQNFWQLLRPYSEVLYTGHMTKIKDDNLIKA